jgi:hypothetical protein
MALGTMTMNMNAGGRPSAPVYQIDVSFTLDSSYPTGGTPGFTALVIAAARAAATPLTDTFAAADIVGVKVLDGFGYDIKYDKANDKLKVYWCGGSGSPMAEVTNTTNLSSTTVRLIVEHQ